MNNRTVPTDTEGVENLDLESIEALSLEAAISS